MNFTLWLNEKYEALAGGSHGHYGHIPDNAFHGSGATGAAANLFKHMQHRPESKSDLVAQKKTDGSVSVVTVRNSKDSPYHNPNHPESAVGVAYKGRMDAKTVPNHEKVSYSPEEVAHNYGKDHHLTPVLSTLVQHAHKIHGTAPIIQHDIHTTNPSKDLHHEDGKVSWQPNTIRNSTTDPHEIKKLKDAKVVLASHTGFDKDFHHARGLSNDDVKQHKDVYNVNLEATKIHHKELDTHNKAIGEHLKNADTRKDLDTVANASYNDKLERFTNHKVNKGEYGDKGQGALQHHEFKKFVSDIHDKEIAKVKTDKAKSAKTDVKNKELSDIDAHKSALETAFKVHRTLTNASADYVNKMHKADANSPIKHELPDGKGGFTPAPFEGVVGRSKHEKVNSQKINDRSAFNRMNKLNGEQRFGKKEVKESTESEHAIIVPGARMHPPTMAHDALINDTVNRAKKVGGKAHIFLTKNKPGDEKSPLSAEHRVEMLNHAYKDHIKSGHLEFHVGTGMHKNMEDFQKAHPHVKHVHVVLGDDRMDAGDSLKKYNGAKDKSGHTPYKFDTLEVHQREKTPSKYDTIHATELRNKARSNDDPKEVHKFFKERMHPNIPDHLIKKTISDIKSSGKKSIKESFIDWMKKVK